MRTLIILLSTLCSLFAFAQDDVEKSLTADAEFGLLFTSGNTETESIKGKLDIRHDMAKWKNNYVIEGFTKKDQTEIVIDDEVFVEKIRTAEKYFSSLQTDFKLNSENRGLFMFGSYEEDHFSGYDYQGTFAVGYSDRLFKTMNSQLNYSIGPGMSFTKTEDVVDNDGILIEGETEQTGVLRLSFNYLYQISKTAKFIQNVASDMALESGKNTKTKSETALSVNILSALALKAGFTINYNSEVPESIEHADTQTSITIVYSY